MQRQTKQTARTLDRIFTKRGQTANAKAKTDGKNLERTRTDLGRTQRQSQRQEPWASAKSTARTLSERKVNGKNLERAQSQRQSQRQEPWANAKAKPTARISTGKGNELFGFWPSKKEF